MVLAKFKRIKGITLNAVIIVLSCGAIFGYGTGIIDSKNIFYSLKTN